MWRSTVLAIALAGCEWGGGSDVNGLLRGVDARTGADGQQATDASGGHDGAVPTADAASVDGAALVDAPPQQDAVAGCAFSGLLAAYSFAGLAGSQVMTAAASTAPGVTASGITRSSAISPASGAGSMNASNWPTAAQLDSASFYTLTITPPAGCTMSVTALAIDAKSSGTGPANGAVATSADGFAQSSPVATAAPSTPAVAATGVSTSLEIRIYGYAASASIGTLRLQNQLSITGTLQ